MRSQGCQRRGLFKGASFPPLNTCPPYIPLKAAVCLAAAFTGIGVFEEEIQGNPRLVRVSNPPHDCWA